MRGRFDNRVNNGLNWKNDADAAKMVCADFHLPGGCNKSDCKKMHGWGQLSQQQKTDVEITLAAIKSELREHWETLSRRGA